MLLLAHVKLFGLMTEKSMLSNSSVIEGTYSLFKQITSGNASTADLGGGMIGAVLFSLFHLLFDSAGTKIISFFLILIGMILITGKSLGDVFEKMGKKIGSFIKAQWGVFLQDIKDWKEERREKVREKEKIDKKLLITKNNTKDIEVIVDEPISAETEVVSEPIISSFTERAYPVDENRANPKEVETEENTVEPDEAVATMAITEVENKDYQLPPHSLLTLPKATDQSDEYKLIHSNAAKLEQTFQSFGVKAKVTQVHLGPAVTKYEVHPDAGVKVSRIVSLSDDLALALAAEDIRIEAPIPGKSAIGIEVPNSEVAIVSLREVLDSKNHIKPEAKLQIGLGRDITGEAVVSRIK